MFLLHICSLTYFRCSTGRPPTSGAPKPGVLEGLADGWLSFFLLLTKRSELGGWSVFCHFLCGTLHTRSGVCGKQLGTVRLGGRCVRAQFHRGQIHHKPMLPFGPSTQLEFLYFVSVGFYCWHIQDRLRLWSSQLQ